MADFIEEAAQLSSNMFGKNVGKGGAPPTKATKPGGPKRTTLHVATQGTSSEGANTSSKKCPCCSEPHYLAACSSFKKMNRDERKKMLRDARICDNCFGPSHIAKHCWHKPNCRVSGCRWKHHTLLHLHDQRGARTEHTGTSQAESKPNGQAATGAGDQTTVKEDTKGSCHSTINSSRKVCLRIVPVKIQAGGKETKTWALLDEGSDVSLCDASLVEELGLSGTNRQYDITTVNGTTTQIAGLEVTFTVKNLNAEERVDMQKVWTVKSLPISDALIPDHEDIQGWDHLRGIEFPSIDQREVKLLISGDTPEAFWVLEQRRGKKKEPYAIRSPLRWTLMGPMSTRKGPSSVNVHFTCYEDPLQQQLKQFWESDYGGYLMDEKTGDSVEDRRALKIMKESTSIVEGHYEVGLPWRHWPPDLPNSRHLAEARLRYLKKKLEKDAALHAKYTTTVEDYVTKGYAEKVLQTQAEQRKEKDEQPISSIWYLPHHAVVHPQKPDKVRVVFDCAARCQGTSLNDELLQGPDHTNNLVGVLLRFRQEPIAVVGDVEAMFHQVKVPERDCDALRFLWWENGDLASDPKEYRMKVHLFGATSSPSCAGFALRKTAEDHQNEYDRDVIDTVQKNFYVDDCLKSVKTKEAAIKLIEDLRQLLKEGGFRLTK